MRHETDYPDATDAEVAYTFGRFQFSVARQLLTIDGQPVRLGSRALSILIALVERSGELISKEDLVASVWPDTHVGEGNLRVHIAALRKALGDSGNVPQLIVNVAGRGYRFAAPVQRVADSADLVFEDARSLTLGNLPADIAHVIGRDSDIDALRKTMRQSRHLTLTGPGGIGKTTLALALAHRIRANFRAGTYFIDLAAVSDPAVVPFAIASAVRVAIDTEQPVESLVGRLQADHALLVIDNCEHLIDGAATVVESLLRGGPHLHILATSHEPLRTQGERVYRLMPFDLPAQAETMQLRDAIQLPAIELFVERMMANDDAISIGDSDVPFIVEICRRLDGLPLAIEIAASRAAALGVAELASRLDDRFSILTDGRRTAVSRHQTLRNMLDWSHELLAERDRIVLRRLGVFGGEFSLEAASMVAGDERLNASTVMDAVSSLVRRSLLMQSNATSASLFRLLDSSRIYALEKLGAAAELRRVRLLHVHYLCDVLARAEKEWTTTPAAEWTGTYQRYVDDIRTALTWAFGEDGHDESGVLLTSLALPLAHQLGLHDEFRERMFLAMERARALAKPSLVPELRLHVAKNTFTFNIGRPVDVVLERAMELAERTGKDRHHVEPLVQISSCHAALGQYKAAAQVGARALDLAQKSGDEYAVLSASRALAQAAHYVGQHETAITLARAVLQHPVENIPYTYGFMHTDRRVSMRFILVRSLWISGRADEAVRVAQEGLEIAREAGPVALAQLLGVGVIPMYFWRGDLATARTLTTQLLDHSERYSFKYWKGWALMYREVLSWHDAAGPLSPPNGDLQRQTLSTLVGRATPLSDTIDNDDWSGPELIRLRADALLAAGDRAGGETVLLEAIGLARRQGALSWELRAATGLAQLWSVGATRYKAVEMLSDVLGRMPEGHDTADAAAAHALVYKLT